ncbi:transcriptional regulator [Gemmobacter denitrificans]|uniref:Transcriptional regulator n=1 Tax=Gemmobacter denitrificans TaxID=3123040 RepID=A0ABU8BTA2_9RHOB
MARKKIIPDTEVYQLIRTLLAQGGDKAVSFHSVGRACGLAAPTLVQRFGARDAMLRAALADGWDRLEAATMAIETEAPLTAKGAQAFLKALAEDAPECAELALLAADFRDALLRDRAESWRARVEAAIASRLGGGAKAREAAAILFAAWQGQQLWLAAGGKGFRLKDAVQRLK